MNETKKQLKLWTTIIILYFIGGYLVLFISQIENSFSKKEIVLSKYKNIRFIARNEEENISKNILNYKTKKHINANNQIF